MSTSWHNICFETQASLRQLKAKAEDTMSNEKSLSLCCNCKSNSDCILRTKKNLPLLYCEQFEIEILPPSPESLQKETSRSCSGEKLENDCTEALYGGGLCADCQNRASCSLRSGTEGGVWHCEEYE